METQSKAFLTSLQKAGKSPNFWMSEEYIEKALLEYSEMGGKSGYKDEDGNWYFPYIEETGGLGYEGVHVSFQDHDIGPLWDYEYLYDPIQFLNLSGKKWKVFRRHILKWDVFDWEYKPLHSGHNEELEGLFLLWAKDRELYDPDTFVRYVFEGENRFGLFLDGVLKGVNIADESWEYVNYRYCFDTGEEFLNEYVRWRFYTSTWVQERHKIVNDGGSLGSEGLARFKNKLRPVHIQQVFTGAEQ